MNAELLTAVVGGPELLDWFGGRAPSFHDAEVLSITLDRNGASCTFKIHAFEMTSEIDGRGYFVSTRHTVVTLRFGEVSDLELADFNHQNVLMGLSLSKSPEDEFVLNLDPAYGLGGTLRGRTLSIAVEPGIPEGSQYLAPSPRPSDP